MAKQLMAAITLCAFGLMAILVVTNARSIIVDDISCNEAVANLMPCQPYLVGKDATPSGKCCTGLKTVDDRANTKDIRRQLCPCLKQAAATIGVLPEKAKGLPNACKLKVSIPLDPETDCDK